MVSHPPFRLLARQLAATRHHPVLAVVAALSIFAGSVGPADVPLSPVAGQHAPTAPAAAPDSALAWDPSATAAVLGASVGSYPAPSPNGGAALPPPRAAPSPAPSAAPARSAARPAVVAAGSPTAAAAERTRSRPSPRPTTRPTPRPTEKPASGQAGSSSAGDAAPQAAAPSVAPAPSPTPSPSAPAALTYSGSNHVWIPSLGVSKPVYDFPCTRAEAPDNLVYTWGCAGENNTYLLGHAYGVFKPLHDAYYDGRLKKGLQVVYADGSGIVHTYGVTWWRLTPPTYDAEWAWDSLPTPGMTLQTCIGAHGELRLMVRLDLVS